MAFKPIFTGAIKSIIRSAIWVADSTVRLWLFILGVWDDTGAWDDDSNLPTEHGVTWDNTTFNLFANPAGWEAVDDAAAGSWTSLVIDNTPTGDGWTGTSDANSRCMIRSNFKASFENQVIRCTFNIDTLSAGTLRFLWIEEPDYGGSGATIGTMSNAVGGTINSNVFDCTTTGAKSVDITIGTVTDVVLKPEFIFNEGAAECTISGYLSYLQGTNAISGWTYTASSSGRSNVIFGANDPFTAEDLLPTSTLTIGKTYNFFAEVRQPGVKAGGMNIYIKSDGNTEVSITGNTSSNAWVEITGSFVASGTDLTIEGDNFVTELLLTSFIVDGGID